MQKTDQIDSAAPLRPATARTRGSRLKAAWRAAITPVAGVPRWAQIAAYTIPFTLLPSGIWRLFALTDDEIWLGEKVYIVCLSIGAELLAFTAVGLIASWGERIPDRIPGLWGRSGHAVTPAG
jgi:hypothetical protein